MRGGDEEDESSVVFVKVGGAQAKINKGGRSGGASLTL